MGDNNKFGGLPTQTPQGLDPKFEATYKIESTASAGRKAINGVFGVIWMVAEVLGLVGGLAFARETVATRVAARMGPLAWSILCATGGYAIAKGLHWMFNRFILHSAEVKDNYEVQYLLDGEAVTQILAPHQMQALLNAKENIILMLESEKAGASRAFIENRKFSNALVELGLPTGATSEELTQKAREMKEAFANAKALPKGVSVVEFGDKTFIQIASNDGVKNLSIETIMEAEELQRKLETLGASVDDIQVVQHEQASKQMLVDLPNIKVVATGQGQYFLRCDGEPLIGHNVNIDAAEEVASRLKRAISSGDINPKDIEEMKAYAKTSYKSIRAKQEA